MKTVVITGTDRGLGLSIAHHLLKAGNLVFAGCLDAEGEGPLSLLQINPHSIHLVPVDIADPKV